MTDNTILSYLKHLFNNETCIILSAIVTILYNFFFPETQYLYGAIAVLGVMVLDLVTKLYSLKRIAGSWKIAFDTRDINSKNFMRGTIDKLIIFGIMMIICGFAYKLTIISSVAVWFTQIVFTLMFLRDVLSILENLSDAGVKGLNMFKKAVEKKLDDYVDLEEDITSNTITENKVDVSSFNSTDNNNTNNPI